METNYSRWKPILLVCHFSDPYFYFFFRRSPFFCLQRPFNFFSFPHLYRRLSTLLLPLHLTAPLKPTTPLPLLRFTTNQISESSSVFSPFSDRNFLGMDEKFAITFGMGDVTSLRHLRPPVSTFHFSSLVGDHFTNFGYHTVAKSSTPFSEAWHSRPRTPILMTPSRLDIPLFTDT